MLAGALQDPADSSFLEFWIEPAGLFQDPKPRHWLQFIITRGQRPADRRPAIHSRGPATPMAAHLDRMVGIEVDAVTASTDALV